MDIKLSNEALEAVTDLLDETDIARVGWAEPLARIFPAPSSQVLPLETYGPEASQLGRGFGGEPITTAGAERP